MSTPAKRLEPFAVPGGLRGTLARLSLPELLRELQERAATGILALTSGGARKALYLKAGRVVFASSNLPTDRLGEVLLRGGKITRDQNETSVRALAQGRRQGRALVETGALSPQELWSAVQAQVSEIVFSVFQWDEGQFHFEESVLPEKERITVDLDVTALVLEGLRRADPASAMRGRELDGYLVLEPGTTSAEGLLQPWEAHVLSLVDGEKSVVELCQESEAGEGQTQKVLYAFLATGHPALARAQGAGARPGLRARGHGDGARRLLQQDVPPRARLHGARGRPDRRERPRQVPGHGARRRGRRSCRTWCCAATARSRSRRSSGTWRGCPRTSAARRSWTRSTSCSTRSCSR